MNVSIFFIQMNISIFLFRWTSIYFYSDERQYVFIQMNINIFYSDERQYIFLIR